MNYKKIYTFAVLAFGFLLSGCRSNIDLNNVDAQAELQLGMAVPVGSVNFQVADFIGNVKNLYVDSLDHKGVLTFRIDTTLSRYYHQVDLSKHISEKTLELNVHDKLAEDPAMAQMISVNGKITGDGNPITLDFPLTIKLSGINSATEDLGERLDSALIENASFYSTIDTSHLPLKWEWIDRVTLDLGPQITRPAGNTMVVYDKMRDTDPSHFGYNKEVPTAVDNFSVVLMKNRQPSNWRQYLYNVVDTCQFQVHFTFTIPQGTQIEVPNDAKFNYNLKVQFVDFKAVWGMFEPSSDMRSEELVDLGSAWGELEFLKHAHIPFSDPVVDVNIGTQIAGALYIDSAYVFGIDQDGVRTNAEFKDGKTYRRVVFEEGEWLPLSSEIGAISTNMNVQFNNTPDGGQIHRLFRNVPQKVGYKFAVKFDETQTPQIRLTNNTAINVKATATLPFMFNEGLQINYSDTVKDINLSQFTIDSLLANVKEVDSMKVNMLRVALTAQNEIPVCLKATMKCLDETGKVIMDPETPEEELTLFETDTIHLKAPTYANNGGWHKAAPGETQIIGILTQPKIDLLPQIKQIVFSVTLDDESLQEAYKQGLTKVQIMDTDRLRLSIGLFANVDAFVNFNKNNNTGNQK